MWWEGSWRGVGDVSSLTGSNLLLPRHPRTGRGMCPDHPPIYMMYYLFRSTVTTGVVGVCVVAGCVSWLCVCGVWYVLFGVSGLWGYVL